MSFEDVLTAFVVWLQEHSDLEPREAAKEFIANPPKEALR